MAKGQEFDFSKYDKRHLRNIARMAGEIEGFFSELNQKAVNAVINFGVKADNDDFDFFFGDFPAVNKIVGDALNEFREEFSSLIERGNEQAWLLSNEKNAELVKSLQKRAGWSDEMVSNLQKPNVDALQAFQERKVNGMNLSQRVWNLTQQHKESLELAIECGLADGTDPQKLSRVVRGYLNEPNRLFRRVRDKKTGQLRLSKAAAAYHPGRGVYRSSYKNAIRMSGTETNMAYRTADFDKWKKIDFVIGVEVRLSPTNHTLNGVPFFDVCDQLAGTYPKDFKFVGWHPNCRCFAIPKLPTREEMRRRRMAVIDGGEKYEFRQVTEMPENFTSWIATNTDRIMRAKNPPYFIKDNFVGGDIAKGYRWLDAAEKREWREIGEESKTLTTLEKAAIRHAARTEEEIARIRRMAANRQAVIASGDSYNLAFIRSHAPEFGVSTKALERAYINGNFTTKASFSKFKKKLDETFKIIADKDYYWEQTINGANLLKKQISKYTSKQAKELLIKIDKAFNEKLKRTFKDSAELDSILQGYIDEYQKIKDLAKMSNGNLIVLSKEQKKNVKELEKLTKVKAGNPMTREDADMGAENPNYSKGGGYRVNCQTCTMTHLARRFGLDVEAISNDKDRVWKYMQNNNTNWRQRFLNNDGSIPKSADIDSYIYRNKISTRKNKGVDIIKDFFNSTMSKDGLYEIYCGWKRGSAHVFLAESKGGVITYFDPQNKNADAASYVYEMNLHLIEVLRIDDKIINPKMAGLFLPK